MPLLGHAILAIWNDIAPGGDAEFNHWHISEHFPERLACRDSCAAGDSDVASGTPAYFNLYETESVDVLQSPGYLARLNAPYFLDHEVHPALPEQPPHRLPQHGVPGAGRGRGPGRPGAGPARRDGDRRSGPGSPPPPSPPSRAVPASPAPTSRRPTA